ncbi:D-sedoheptulose 7-phosphate isomerase [Candidatus Parvarchaeota archaeon]|nr:D-sedoheptulose 7-phosphate isomerase [Candidatus Parvarchaeota archaeon]
MEEKIKATFEENVEVHKKAAQLAPKLAAISKALVKAYRGGNKMLIFGNGGSAADAQHIAAELVGKYMLERPSMPALALNVNASAMTATANDYSYDNVFERQVEGLAVKGDVVVGISTSGNAQSVIRGLGAGRKKGCTTVLLTGATGGRAHGIADFELNVPSNKTPRIQEVHILCGHIICEIIEQEMFGKK